MSITWNKCECTFQEADSLFLSQETKQLYTDIVYRCVMYEEWWESTPVTPWLSYSPLDPRFAGSNPAGVDGFLSERENSEYDFVRKGRKAADPM